MIQHFNQKRTTNNHYENGESRFALAVVQFWLRLYGRYAGGILSTPTDIPC